MQVSIACTDHNLKRGNGDHSKSATSPNVVNQARAKFRTVAIIARSFGSFTPRHISLKESTGKHTGMKYSAAVIFNTGKQINVVFTNSRDAAQIVWPAAHPANSCLGSLKGWIVVLESWKVRTQSILLRTRPSLSAATPGGSLQTERSDSNWVSCVVQKRDWVEWFYQKILQHRKHSKRMDPIVLSRGTFAGKGTWVTFGGQITDEVAEQLMTIAYESGVNLFDTAEVYAGGRAEIILGNIIKKKCWSLSGLKGSLQRMQLEYVDVVFANRPDSNTPMEEIVRAMTYVINQGMAMYWGTSRWTAMEIMEAYSVARQFNLIPPVCEQAEYHLFQREKSYQWLKEKIVSEDGRKQQAKLKELNHIAEKLVCTLPQLAVAWCLRNEGVSSVLLGTSNPEQLTENLGAIQVLPKMTSHVVSEIDHILGNRPYSKKDYRS
ncbi:hypothetical protein FQN60_004749 [Etheostoma spectabile]|uniref:NADP-dependent oxidoreductase domain-containing protein n=1 Tax=Etheostoma spectabile TaxID=54343 RepID=A0A5J5DKJ4_9PERO|nr:hypothetical protein FQN60_004749 [Etheostoma spectabile]